MEISTNPVSSSFYELRLDWIAIFEIKKLKLIKTSDFKNSFSSSKINLKYFFELFRYTSLELSTQLDLQNYFMHSTFDQLPLSTD